MANFQAHSNMLSQQQEWLTNICDRQLQSFNTLSQQQFQSFHDLNAQALAQPQTQSPYATAPQHGPSAIANAAAVQLPEINTSTPAAFSVQQSVVNTSAPAAFSDKPAMVNTSTPAASSAQQSLQIQVGPTVSTLPVAVQQAQAVANSSTPAASFVQPAVVNNSTSGPATAAMNPELVTAVVGSNMRAQIEFRPLPKAVPRITLSRRPHCQELFFFDKRVPVTNELLTGQEQSDKEDHESLELYHDDSSCTSVNLGDDVPESRWIIPNTSHPEDHPEDHELKALLEFCPVSLTYSNKKCPLGDNCTLKKICHNTTRKHGCLNKDCEFSHEHTVSCGNLLKNGHCRFLEGKGCRYNHDQESRTTVRELIPDHVEYRIFGAKKQVVEEAVTQHDGNTDEVEQPVTQHTSDEVERPITQHD